MTAAEVAADALNSGSNAADLEYANAHSLLAIAQELRLIRLLLAKRPT